MTLWSPISQELVRKLRPILAASLDSRKIRDKIVTAARASTNPTFNGIKIKKDLHLAVRREWKRLSPRGQGKKGEEIGECRESFGHWHEETGSNVRWSNHWLLEFAFLGSWDDTGCTCTALSVVSWNIHAGENKLNNPLQASCTALFEHFWCYFC